MGKLGFRNWQEYAACSFALLSLFLLPISTAGASIATASFVVTALSSKLFWKAIPVLIRKLWFYCLLAFLALIALSLFWTPTSLNEAIKWGSKYKKLLLIPLLLPFFQKEEAKKIGLIVFLVSTGLVLVFSYTNYLGLTQIGPSYFNDEIRRGWVFKHHIAQSFSTALIIPVAYYLAIASSSKFKRFLLYSLIFFAAMNIFFVLHSRTGQISFIVISILIAIKELKQLRFFILLLYVLTLITFLFQFPNLKKSISEAEDYWRHNTATSIGIRLELYRKSLLFLQQKPLLGHGAGSMLFLFKQSIEGQTGATGVYVDEAHNEFFSVAIQCGSLGLILLLAFFVLFFKENLKNPGIYSRLNFILLISFAVTCAGNSSITNNSGGLFVFLAGILYSLSSPSQLSTQTK